MSLITTLFLNESPKTTADPFFRFPTEHSPDGITIRLLSSVQQLSAGLPSFRPVFLCRPSFFPFEKLGQYSHLKPARSELRHPTDRLLLFLWTLADYFLQTNANLSKRSLVLNHEDCQLTVHVNHIGTWSINGFTAVSSPIAFGSVIGVFLVGVFMVGLLFLLLGKEFLSSEQNNQRIA